MNLRNPKSIQELLDAGVISNETAQKIQDYYEIKKSGSSKVLTAVFSIIGAASIGLGIILIIAHNWDQLSRIIKTIIAFLPLLTGQLICGYVLLKKKNNTAWKEGSAAFLFFGVAACVSMISQIYHVPGTLSSFLFTWMLLALPIPYVMGSATASLLYLCGITYYAAQRGYFEYSDLNAYWYWVLLLLFIPFIYVLYRKKQGSNFLVAHNLVVPLSLTIALGTLTDNAEMLMAVAYLVLFAVFFLAGEYFFPEKTKPLSNPYKWIGSLGTICLLLVFSFQEFWREVYDEGKWSNGMFNSPEFIAVVVLSIAGSSLIALLSKSPGDSFFEPMRYIFLAFLMMFFFIGISFPLIAMVLTNLIVLFCGVHYIRRGTSINHFGILNYGLLIVIALACCRFFDDNLSFVLRGSLFVGAGVLFFATNYVMLQRRKKLIENR